MIIDPEFLLCVGAQGIIIVYDVTDRDTFDNVRTWITEIEKYSTAGVCKILVGNKCDMEDRRQVTYEEGKEFAGQFGMPFLETSAKATQNVDMAFDTMTREIKEKMSSKQTIEAEEDKQAYDNSMKEAYAAGTPV